MKILYITAPAGQQAETLARMLVREKLAACVNLLPASKSFFQWEGEVQEDNEQILMVKASASRVEDIKKAVLEAHPYDCPAILVLDVEEGHSPFLQWVEEETAS